MEFIKSWKFMALIVGVLAVVAISGVIYGVTTHQEAGFMPGSPMWDRESFPLLVCAEDASGRPEPAQRTSLEYVVELVNHRTGFETYRVADADCSVMVAFGVPAEPGWMDPGGDALFDQNASGPFCFARISNVHGELMTLTVYHELGHCLGLAHDDYRQSIMYPSQRPTPDGVIPPWISDYDVHILRDRYLNDQPPETR